MPGINQTSTRSSNTRPASSTKLLTNFWAQALRIDFESAQLLRPKTYFRVSATMSSPETRHQTWHPHLGRASPDRATERGTPQHATPASRESVHHRPYEQNLFLEPVRYQRERKHRIRTPPQHGSMSYTHDVRDFSRPRSIVFHMSQLWLAERAQKSSNGFKVRKTSSKMSKRILKLKAHFKS